MAAADSQLVELAGRNWLASQLQQAGIEIARPERDRGVDLIAYIDRDDRVPHFIACPVQMKAATKEVFSLSAKYGEFSGSACSYLRAIANERNETEADKLLSETTVSSKNVDHAEAYEIYKGLSQEVRLSLLRSITVLDNAPNITDVVDEIRQVLYMAAPKTQITNFVERLEGWWLARVIDGLVNKKSIPLLAIDQRIDELREEFQRDALPVDVKGSVPSPEVIAELDKRPFVQQLRRIKIGTSRIELAIRDYYRAFEQRSRWTRQELLVDGELERYEEDLKEAWEPRFLTLLDSLPTPCEPETKISGGQKIFQWAEQDADFPLRSVRERFLTHGSFQMLANRNVVGWHPDFKKPENNDDSEKDEK